MSVSANLNQACRREQKGSLPQLLDWARPRATARLSLSPGNGELPDLVDFFSFKEELRDSHFPNSKIDGKKKLNPVLYFYQNLS